jgi:hypothetical protein
MTMTDETKPADTTTEQAKPAKPDNPLLQDNPKTPWDVVNEIDWGDRIDDLKASAGEQPASVPPAEPSPSSTPSTPSTPSDTSTSADKPASTSTSSTTSTKATPAS